MSQGLSFRALADEFQIRKSTAIGIVQEVCIAIINNMGSEQLPLPKHHDWIKNAEGFERLGFPRAIGAMDGKYFWIKVIYYIVLIHFSFSNHQKLDLDSTITKVFSR